MHDEELHKWNSSLVEQRSLAQLSSHEYHKENYVKDPREMRQVSGLYR
jgi:hypothetical protein